MLPKRALKTFLKDPSNCCVETKTRAGGSWRAEPGWGNKLGKRHRGMEHRQDGRSGGGRFHDLFSSWSPKDLCRERERGVKCDAKYTDIYRLFKDAIGRWIEMWQSWSSKTFTAEPT